MKKKLISVLSLCCAFALCSTAYANEGDGLTTVETNSDIQTTEIKEVAATNDDDVSKKIDKVLSLMPKVSGYLQTGYMWNDKNAGDNSTFQMKRMRLFLDKKISNMFDFRAQFEVFSGSTDGTPYSKKVMTIMDAYLNAHISDGLHFRAGQYFIPLGFENYDISPATLEVVDFSNICYRMECRNAVNTPGLVDYGRDVGIMAYGDLFKNKDKGFHYLHYALSLTNGQLPTLTDDNKSKDFVGRLTVRPIEKLRIMGSYNWGEYQKGSSKYNKMDRVVAGAWYFDPNGLTLRSEYGYMESKDANVREEGVYVLAGYKVNKFLPVVRWDSYRDKKDKTDAINKDVFTVGCTYEVLNNVKLQANYHYTDYSVDGAKSGNGIQLMVLAKF